MTHYEGVDMESVDQGARVARYGEAITGSTREGRSSYLHILTRDVMAVADAEVADAVSEAQAEMRAKWAADVANVQAVALAQRNDAVAYRAEVERLREVVDEYDGVLSRQGDLLTRTANALRGDPPELTSWSHHDVPERAQEVVALLAKVKSLAAEHDHCSGCPTPWWLRASLSPSPAATTGEARLHEASPIPSIGVWSPCGNAAEGLTVADCRLRSQGCQCFPARASSSDADARYDNDDRYDPDWETSPIVRPAPVSSGEAAREPEI